MTARRVATMVTGLIASGIMVLAVALFLARRHAAEPARGPSCTLGMPHSNISPIVFPKKSGSESLDAAIIGNADDSAVRRVIAEQGGFIVPSGTACSELEPGAMYSQVLVIEGPFAGKSVWLPSIHTRGG